MVSTYIYNLPKNTKKQILLDSYNALRKLGLSHDEARHKVSHEVVCEKLYELDGLININDYLS